MTDLDKDFAEVIEKIKRGETLTASEENTVTSIGAWGTQQQLDQLQQARSSK